jgi:hypothetical protein
MGWANSTYAMPAAAATVEIAAADSRRTIMWIINNTGAAVYIGHDAIDATDGFPLPDGERIVFYTAQDDQSVRAPLYAMAAAATTAPNLVRVLEFSP